MQTATVATAPVTVPVKRAGLFLQWTPVFAGAAIGAALSFILLTFGAAIGLSVSSSAPTWRDASFTLAWASGLYLLLTAIVSFGLGGYVAGRLRERWEVHSDLIEFRDGIHGVVAWAIAVAISGLLLTATAAMVSSKGLPASASPTANTGETLFPADLDRLFRSDKHPEGDVSYSRAEAGRILLKAAGRTGITDEDKTYLASLVASRTGITQPDAQKRVDIAITNSTTAVHKARRSAVVLAFSLAVSLLCGAAAAWYGATWGGEMHDPGEVYDR